MKKVLLLYCCFGFFGSLIAQSLLQDAHLLVQASSVLIQPDSTTTPAAKQEALGQLVAILWFYDQDRRNQTQPSLKEIINRYQNNNTINDLIGGLALNQISETDAFKTSLTKTQTQLASGPREEILQLLYAQQAMDPADYLSLMQTLREYQEPPVGTLAAIQAPATASSQERNSGTSLFSEEAIIRGLFSFLIERAGEELVVTFLDRLLGKEMSTVAELFPTVITLYSTTDYAYSDSFLASLRDAFLEDFQLLDLRLPELLLTDDLFGELQADPVFYNLLTVYTVVALTRDESVTIDEAVPLVARNLYQRYQDTEKQRNLLLAAKAYSSPQYRDVIAALDSAVRQTTVIYGAIEETESGLNNRVEDLAFSADEVFQIQAEDAFTIVEKNGDRFKTIFKAEGEDDYDLIFVPSLLKGELPQTIVDKMGTLDSYDKFLASPTSPQSRRAAGLAIARRLTGQEFGTTTLDQYFLEWRDTLIKYENRILQIEVAADSAATSVADLLKARKEKVDTARKELSDVIMAARENWNSLLLVDEDNALLVLHNILGNLDISLPGTDSTPVAKIIRQENDLIAVKSRLLALHQRIEGRVGAQALQPDPIAAYNASPIPVEPMSDILNASLKLRNQLTVLREKLITLDTIQARNLSRSHENALPLLQTGEVFSHLMYLLRTDSDSTENHFLNRDQLKSTLLNDTIRNAFLGLVVQELGQSQDVGVLSTDGLSFLLQATVQELGGLPERVEEAPDSLKFYQKSTFVVNTLNRLLQTPLLVDPLQPDSVIALTQQFPSLARVPEISADVLQMIFFITTKNYRQALSKTLETTIRLTEQANENIDSTKKVTARDGLVRFLHQYGGFIGGMVEADSARQVHALLQAFADPPGSSRVKRQRPFTAGLNAYVGGIFGREHLSGSTSADSSRFWTAAPSIPVGVTFSKLIGKKYSSKRASFSMFVSVIDLGSLATFNLSEDLDGDNQLTFRNILKPGVQLQWNIPKSPFFLGAGTQWGPHYRQFGEELEAQRSFRYFISFGIDIVIKRFY